MISIEGNKEALYQWEKNRRIIFTNLKAETLIDFSHEKNQSEDCPCVKSYEENGKVYANVPNILLQKNGIIKVYIRIQDGDTEYTEYQGEILVIYRPKPTDYIYTEVELVTVEEIAKKTLREELPKLDVVPRMSILDEERIKEIGEPNPVLFAKFIGGDNPEYDPTDPNSVKTFPGYNRVYVELSRGRGVYSMYALTDEGDDVPLNPWSYSTDENGNPIYEPLSSLVERRNTGDIYVPLFPGNDYSAVSRYYLSKVISDSKKEIEGDIAKLQIQIDNFNSVYATKKSEMVVIDDITSTAKEITIKGSPNATYYLRGINFAPSNKVTSSYEDRAWACRDLAIHPPKNTTYRFSCKFHNDASWGSSTVRVAIAVKPDASSISTIYEPTSVDTYGTFSVDVPLGDYKEAVYLRFYSNYSNDKVWSKCEFYDIVFTPVSLEVTPGTEGVVEQAVSTNDVGEAVVSVPKHRPIVIHSIDNEEIEVGYNTNLLDLFVTQKQLEETVGTIDKALDSIIAIQNELIGGNT